MIIRRAISSDLAAIQQLLKEHSGHPIGPEHLNKRDIALVARGTDGSLAGFIWCGLMAKNTTGYIACFCVHPDWRGKGVGAALGKRVMQEAARQGATYVFGAIREGASHDASAVNALKIGMASDPVPCTYVYASVPKALHEIASLEH